MFNAFAERGMIVVPLPKNAINYQKGGLHWNPCGRSADGGLQNIGVTDDMLDVARRPAANVARAAKVVKGQEIFVV